MRYALSVIAIALLLGAGYVAYAVELGSRTLVEHVRAIAGTREAKALAQGTREEAGKVAHAAADTAGKAARTAADSAGHVVRRALGRDERRLPEPAEGEPPVKLVDRPASGAAPKAAPAAPATKPGPPDERLDDKDRAGLDRLVRSASR